MKYSVLIIALCAVFGGCTANPEANRANSAPNSVNSGNTNIIVAANSNAAGNMAPYNGVQNINPNAFNAANDNLKVIPSQSKNDALPYGTRNSPDESTVTAGSRGRDFVETRTFKNHPTLAKVEKVMDGKNIRYKVFLKNGKSFDAPAEKMNNFTALSPESILDAIGMLPKAPAVTEGKKEENPE